MWRGVVLALAMVAGVLAWSGPAAAQRIIHVVPEEEAEPAPGGIGSFFDFLFGREQRRAPPPVRQPQRRYVPERAPAPARAPAIRRKPPPPSIFVAMFGDRFADELAGGLSDALANRPDIGIVAEVKPDAGLLDKDTDWQGLAREVHDRNKKVNAVVVMVGPGAAARAASAQRPPSPSAADGESAAAPVRSPWVDLYVARVDELVLTLGQGRTPVVWVGLPPVEDPGLSADHAFLNELVRQRVQALGGIFVDPWDAFADSAGHYAERGPDVEGRIVRLRATDGIHFSDAGARKLGQEVATELRRILGRPGENSDEAAAAAVAAAPHLPGASRIVLLGAPPRSPGAQLLPPATTEPPPGPDAAAAQRAMAEGLPVPSRKGRADDFSWPPDQ
ncbi:MAG TPA: hypothetical protein VHD15_18415 [Hyphomicrobiales bacterium]|nr:hypothetical protein [Hyphomicrobiales bacterium]